jgi:thiamine pyrophosphate-dependent acetolactate synthase large subunit-like protein
MRIVYDQLGMSVRSYHKCLKMARTIADLNGREMILERDLMMAVGFRLPEYNEDEKSSGREFSRDKMIVPANRRKNLEEELI